MNHASSATARSLALIGVVMFGCAGQPIAAPPGADPLVGYYGCAGTNDGSLGATGFVELRADGTFAMRVTLTPVRTDGAYSREAVGELSDAFCVEGRWRACDASFVELDTRPDGARFEPTFQLAAGSERTLELVGPCLSIAFAFARPAR